MREVGKGAVRLSRGGEGGVGKVKLVVRERTSGEKLEEDKAARTSVGRRILLLLGFYFSILCGLGKSGHVSVTACVKWRW